MRTIQSHAHNYTLEEFADFPAAFAAASDPNNAFYLVDRVFAGFHASSFCELPPEKIVQVEATEQNKSFEALTPIFLELLQRGLKRNHTLVVIGGGVLQDIGCFIASVLFRGIRWELLPTTLLAQADSCIGSKSSLNIGSYKNQIGTFYPPNRVLVTPTVLSTLPWDEIRSGLGEVIKLQLLNGEAGFRELMNDLSSFKGETTLLAKWVARSVAVKQPYIESDEFDTGVRNLLNYGHTFGHAYESATHYAIPHGIAVILGILTATFLSARLGLISNHEYLELKSLLDPWHTPYGTTLRTASRDAVLQAIRHDKKSSGNAVNCILTRGLGQMEKRPVDVGQELIPAINSFFDRELG